MVYQLFLFTDNSLKLKNINNNNKKFYSGAKYYTRARKQSLKKVKF